MKANRVNRLIRKLGGPDRVTARAAVAAAALDISLSSMRNGSSRRTDSMGSFGSVDSSDVDAEDDDGGRAVIRRVTDYGITEEFNNAIRADRGRHGPLPFHVVSRHESDII